MLTPLLQSVADELEASDALTPDVLSKALKRPLNIDDVAPWIRFDAGNYVRNLIKRTDRWELRLLCWRPGQSSSVHSHGKAACAFRVLRGSATESALGQRDRTLVPGDIVEESPFKLVHQVSNREDDPLLTLHAYSPPLPVDAPSPREGREILIVGGGFSGVATAYHLLLHGDRDLRITMIERGPWLGRGIAYGVDSAVFRLNVPASRMSIDPAAPNDFVEWAGAQEDPHAFLSRARYGEYVTARLANAIRGGKGKLRLLRSDVVAADEGSVTLEDGTVMKAESIILATGLAPRLAPQQLAADARVIDAWDECAIATLPPDGNILVLGAGLTAIDVISLLHMRRFAGKITILSRRGLLPCSHLSPYVHAHPLSADAIAEAPRSLRPLVQWMRNSVDQAVARGEPWQLAIDSLRPHLSTLWKRLTPEDRTRFLRSFRPYWEVLRHRAPADALAVLERWREAGRLEVIAGKVASCQADKSGLEVDMRIRGGGARRVRFDAIVRCIGPALERAENDSPLMSALLGNGVALGDPTGLGFVTDDRGRVVRPDGRPLETMFAIGALRRPTEWESTAVPDISKQAAAVAKHLLS
jgi:uncharacterized NAD(P)/FAD-binding protein YdhS/quercetin dioxygenase-like cupin family protein